VVDLIGRGASFVEVWVPTPDSRPGFPTRIESSHVSARRLSRGLLHAVSSTTTGICRSVRD
jgi:hypothetical protein